MNRKKKSDGKVCCNCGKTLQQISGKKIRIFCSQQCREQWWKENPDKIKKRRFTNIPVRIAATSLRLMEIKIENTVATTVILQIALEES